PRPARVPQREDHRPPRAARLRLFRVRLPGERLQPRRRHPDRGCGSGRKDRCRALGRLQRARLRNAGDASATERGGREGSAGPAFGRRDQQPRLPRRIELALLRTPSMCRPILLLLLVSTAAAAQAPALDGATSEYALAQSLERRGLSFSAFQLYARIVQAGPAQADWLKSVEGAARAARSLHDDVLAPNLLEKAWTEQFSALPRETQASIHAELALFAYRAGNLEKAARFAERVTADSQAFPQARYV